ncbi:hypothetical protein [Zooshikella harenae]|uniref:MEDS domain-containing protein n=1 Tax=Zooshikella harenae TaxID=2827238 RepID=A0ABS5ZE94_9GAMM|nr:hypothetical protein [Zooshikella harenae]MBU2712387.1 hypothetical protein [Zooshikella harenae]
MKTHTTDVVNFTNIEVAKRFVVEEMISLFDGQGETLIISYDGEPYVENVVKMLAENGWATTVSVVTFDSLASLQASLANREYQHRYQALFIFNSLHRLTDLQALDECFKQVLEEKGKLHVSWPASGAVPNTKRLSEKEIAEELTGSTLQAFDDLRKDDHSYVNALPSFQCQRMVKFDFGLAFQNIEGLKSWHKGGADILFGADLTEDVQALKERYYHQLYTLYLRGQYQARMATTVADFILN